jgi:hypothetical protein
MKLKTLAALLATCEAVHNDEKQLDANKLVGTREVNRPHIALNI